MLVRFTSVLLAIFPFMLYAYNSSPLLLNNAPRDKQNIEKKDIHSYAWEQKTSAPTTFARGAYAFIDRKLYLFSYYNSVHHAYYPTHDTWSTLAPDPLQTSHPTFGTHEKKMFLWGGNMPPVANLRIYDTTSDKWDSLSHDPAPFGCYIGSGRAFQVDCNRLLIVPGNIQSGMDVATDKCYFYNISSATYTQGPRLPRPLYGFALIEDGDNVVLLGGKTSPSEMTNICYIYSISRNTWSDATFLYLPEKTWRGAAFKVKKEYYYVGGGEARASDPSSNRVYRWTGCKWNREADMPYYAGCLAAAETNNHRILIFGGLGSPISRTAMSYLDLCYLGKKTPEESGMKQTSWGGIKEAFYKVK